MLDFDDSFDSLIIEYTSLSEIQMFHYLKVAISGDAANIISSTHVSSNNFYLAWELICERYANNHLLVQSHIIVIFKISKINNKNWQNLRQLTDGVASNLRSLQSLGEPTEHRDSLRTYIITSKLNVNTEKEWE